MVELILAVSVAMAMLVMMAQMQNSAMSEVRAKNMAESLQAFSNLAAQYLVLANAEDGMTRALVDGGVAGADADKFCKVSGVTKNDTTKHVCVVDADGMVAASIGVSLPPNFSATNSYGQKWVAIYKLANATCTADCAIELLIVGTGGESAAKAEEPYLAASLMGGNGGVIPCDGTWSNNCAYSTEADAKSYAYGTGGGWKARLDDFGAK